MRRMKKSIRHRRLLLFMGLAFAISLIWINNQQPTGLLASAPQAFGETAGSKSSPWVIVLDAGHGGNDPGAEGASGTYEKNITLALTEKVYDLLQKESMFIPLMTRTDDRFVELEDRSAYANTQHADAFISIHGNTFDDSAVSGTETYYYAQDSRLLAQTLHQKILKAGEFKDRGVREEEWKVLKYSKVPSVLLEIGFLTNPQDEAYLLGETGQERIAQAIVDGLQQYFGNPT